MCLQNCEPEVIFAANLPIPTRIKKTFSSSQSVFKMVVTQGDDHSELLAKVTSLLTISSRSAVVQLTRELLHLVESSLFNSLSQVIQNSQSERL